MVMIICVIGYKIHWQPMTPAILYMGQTVMGTQPEACGQ
jgi:hypothetical protein